MSALASLWFHYFWVATYSEACAGDSALSTPSNCLTLQNTLCAGVFFCYPTICIVSFATFICRQLTPEISVLDADGGVYCEESSHRALQFVSAMTIAIFACGVPLGFGYILVRAAFVYQRDSAGVNKKMAQQLSAELGVEVATAEYVIRDCTIGRSYSFLMDAYKPGVLYWEV
jgi:hypothetical protein